jgi:hypothetical protein
MHDLLLTLGYGWAGARVVQDAGIWMVQPYLSQIAEYIDAKMTVAFGTPEV